MFNRVKKFFSQVKRLDLSVPALLGHNHVETDEEMVPKKAKTSRFLSKSIEWLDLSSSFLFNRDSPKLSELVRFTWGPLFIGLIVVGIFFGIFGVWAVVAPIEGAVIAHGEVISSSKRKTIQHLEGGIITKISVKEGEVVDANQPLMLLSESMPKSNKALLTDKLINLLANEARLKAEHDNKEDITWSQELLDLGEGHSNIESILVNQQQSFESKRTTFASQIDILNQRIKEAHNELKGLNAQYDAAKKQHAYLLEEMEGKKSLLKEGHISKQNFRALEKQNIDLLGRLGEFEATIARVTQKIEEQELEIISFRNRERERIINELKETSTSVADMRERLNSASDILSRTTIRAPIDGIVTDLKYHTIGGVVGAGAKIMDIVPIHDDLIVDARVLPKDIELVLEMQKRPDHIVTLDGITGMKVKIRLLSYSSRKASMLDAVVTHVSPDILTDPTNGMRYYLVRTYLPKESIRKLPGSIKLYPGMVAEVFMPTESRTLFSYLVFPITSSFSKAFKE